MPYSTQSLSRSHNKAEEWSGPLLFVLRSSQKSTPNVQPAKAINSPSSQCLISILLLGERSWWATRIKKSCIQSCLSAMECPICLDTFTDACTLPCGHSIYHSLLSSLNKCPICRGARRARGRKVSLLYTVALKDSIGALEAAVAMMVAMEEAARQRCFQTFP